MTLNTVCRVCLTMDVPMHVIADSPLQNIYEKLINIPVNTSHGSVVACYICYSQLKKCHNLMIRSIKAEKVLTRIIRSGAVVKEELTIMLNNEAYRYALTKTPIEFINVSPAVHSFEEIKEEPMSPLCATAGEMEIHTSICVEHLKYSEPEDEEYMETVPLEDIESEILINNQVQEESEGVEARSQSMKSRGGALAEQHMEMIEDRITLTPSDKNILDNPRTHNTYIEVEIPSRRTESYCLRSTKNTANTQLSVNKTACSDISINKSNVSDNDCTSNTDIDNTSSKQSTFIYNDCGNTFHDKYLTVEHVTHHDAYKNKRDRNHTKKNLHKHNTLRKQKLTSAHNKQTKSLIGKNVFECEKNVIESKNDVIDSENNVIETENNVVEFEKNVIECKNNVIESENIFKCEICDRTFVVKRNYTRHVMSHTGEKPFECKLCNRRFIRKEYLDKHLRTHTMVEQKNECNVCKLRFKDKATLSRHLNIHSNKKPFKCNECEIRFNRKSNLNRHMKSHTGEKPFQCDVCKKKFSERDKLVIHLRRHTGEKPFQCTVCEERFAQRSTLIRHVRTHTAEKPFECDICHRKFSRNLKRHLKTHGVRI